MGCSQSRIDDEESVQLCQHRKEFMKQAVEQHTRFASGHRAYIQSLQKVSAALHDYIEGDHEPPEFLDSFMRTFRHNTTVEFVPGSGAMKVNYLRPTGNPVVSVEERVQSPEMVQVEACSPVNESLLSILHSVLLIIPITDPTFLPHHLKLPKMLVKVG